MFNTAASSQITVAPAANASVSIKLEDVKNAMGTTVTASGKVYSSKAIASMVLVNLGGAYANKLLTVALKGKAKDLAVHILDKRSR